MENSKKAVMIVDDEPLIRSMLREVLTGAGYVTYTAGDGYEAINLLEVNSPDVVLVDHQLPDTDGLTLQRRIKEIDADIKLIFMSGSHDEDLLMAAQKGGASAILRKPFDITILLDMIDRL